VTLWRSREIGLMPEVNRVVTNNKFIRLAAREMNQRQ
jgi:hypothetical protein